MGLFDALGTALAQAGQGALTGAVQGQQSQIEQGRFNQELALRRSELDQQRTLAEKALLAQQLAVHEAALRDPNEVAKMRETGLFPHILADYNGLRSRAGMSALTDADFLPAPPPASPSAASPPGGPAPAGPAQGAWHPPLALPATTPVGPSPALASVFAGTQAQRAVDAGQSLLGALFAQPPAASAPPVQAWHPPLIGPAAAAPSPAAPQPGISSATRTVAPTAPAAPTVNIPGYGPFSMPPSYTALKNFDRAAEEKKYTDKGFTSDYAGTQADKTYNELKDKFATEMEGIKAPLGIKEIVSKIGLQDAQAGAANSLITLRADTTDYKNRYLDLQGAILDEKGTYHAGLLKAKNAARADSTRLNNARAALYEAEAANEPAKVGAAVAKANAYIKTVSDPATKARLQGLIKQAYPIDIYTGLPPSNVTPAMTEARQQIDDTVTRVGDAATQLESTIPPVVTAPPKAGGAAAGGAAASKAPTGLTAGDFATIAKTIGGGMTAGGVQTIYNEVLHGTYGGYKSRLPDKAHQVMADKVRQALGR